VLRALAQPAAAGGLLVAFLLALAARAVVQNLLAARLGLTTRHGGPWPGVRDVDPLGAIAATLAGSGWGHAGPVADDHGHRRGARAAVLAVGPLTVLALAGIAFFAYRSAYPTPGGTTDSERLSILAGLPADPLSLYRPRDVLSGIIAPPGQQFLLSLAVGLLCFGLLALVPLPPLDGFGLLWLTLRHPREGARKARYWLVEQRVGGVILLALALFPFDRPLLQLFFDLAGTPLMRLWR